jgi:hypothetical protein
MELVAAFLYLCYFHNFKLKIAPNTCLAMTVLGILGNHNLKFSIILFSIATKLGVIYGRV